MRGQYRTLPVVKRLLLQSQVVGECREWTGCTRGGYGKILYRGKSWGTHRLVMTLLLGRKLKRFEFVTHRCNNRRCIRPSHLVLGTPKDNTQHMLECGRGRHQRKGNHGLY